MNSIKFLVLALVGTLTMGTYAMEDLPKPDAKKVVTSRPQTATAVVVASARYNKILQKVRENTGQGARPAGRLVPKNKIKESPDGAIGGMCAICEDDDAVANKAFGCKVHAACTVCFDALIAKKKPECPFCRHGEPLEPNSNN